MTVAVFISETRAILASEAFENTRDDVRHTSVFPVRRRGEMQGYEVKVKFNDGAYRGMTEDEVDALGSL